jgi:hypothetical protein
MAGGSRKGFIPALFGTLYGDQSIFVSPLSFQTPGGFGKIPLMENVEFSKRLRRSGNVALLDPPRQTCPRKHQSTSSVQSRDGAVALGLCRAAVAATAIHLKTARFEHLGQSLGESLPTLRAQLATMQIDTDGLSARVDDLVEHLERPRDTTMLRVLETKAAAGDIAIGVTSAAMRVCGGAAFSKHLIIERVWRDAHAGAVMAPTGDVLREFIARALLGMPLF